MSPPQERVEDTPAEDEQRRHVAVIRRMDAMAHQLDALNSTADHVRALRHEVHQLRAGVEELLHRTRPAEEPPAEVRKAPARPIRDTVYLTAGLAVAAVAVLLTFYLFTRT